jgi:Concanavalin A-like lectin/glucanases superfamily
VTKLRVLIPVLGLLLAVAATVQASGPVPVSYWPADNSALDATDGNHGTSGPGLTYETGYSGQAFKFEGIAADYVRIPFNANLNPPTWTMAAWVKPLGPVSGGIGQTWIFGQNFSKQLVAVPGSDGNHVRIHWQINAGGFQSVSSNAQLPVGEWTHVAGTWDGSYLKVYINGIFDNQFQVPQTPDVYSCQFFIGGVDDVAPCSYSGQFFNGLIDEVKFFGSALSTDEVWHLANRPPVCTDAAPSRSQLWSPDHSLVPVSIVGITDPDGDTVTITINSIFQDEATNGPGDGDASPDGFGTGTSTAELRAERAGNGNGRVYHIAFSADDGFGGTCAGEVRVSVPKSRGQNGAAVDDGALYDSTVP